MIQDVFDEASPRALLCLPLKYIHLPYPSRHLCLLYMLEKTCDLKARFLENPCTKIIELYIYTFT